MKRKKLISLICFVLYLVVFAHAALPHDHLKHDAFGPMCCELLSHDAHDEEHHHLPQHGAEQMSDIYVLQASADSAPVAFLQLVAILEDAPALEASHAPFISLHFSGAPPPLIEAHSAPSGLRAPPAA